jgi:hypothetical protein
VTVPCVKEKFWLIIIIHFIKKDERSVLENQEAGANPACTEGCRGKVCLCSPKKVLNNSNPIVTIYKNVLFC